jgi:Ca2+-binding EF-hand superfamily protein
MMRVAAASRLSVATALLLLPPAQLRAGEEQDQHEEKVLARAAERAFRAEKNDRVLWVREMEAAFPGKAGSPLKEDEYAGWFMLLAGEAGEWKRDAVANTALAGLFDKILQRLELGPVPSIKRDEFMKYVRHRLIPNNPPQNGQAPDPHEDADKVFRVLDRNGDSILEAEEMTTKLRDDRLKTDADGNGRIDRDEYRAYFQRRVTAAVETVARANDPAGSRAGKTSAGGLPDWFAALDVDKDGQIELSEWRKAGKSIDTYLAMDLNGDGLLTKEEYLRYVQMNLKAPPPPPATSAMKPGKN